MIPSEAPLLIAEISAFQDFPEILRQQDETGARIAITIVSFESFFSFPVCCFDGLDWTLHGISPPASPTSMSNEDACRNRD
jgi:hypothetical protein